MVEEVYKNIYRIGVTLPKNPLKELNSYFIHGTDSDLLIDTGFRIETCRKCLEEALEELGSDPDRRDVLATHMHSDHSGMADIFAGKDRAIYMSSADLDLIWKFFTDDSPEYRYYRFAEEGFPRKIMEAFASGKSDIGEWMSQIDPRFRRLEDGDTIKVGDYTLETLLTPGHTPGNCMFYIRDKQVMFTGDHILFTITPNITYWPGTEDALGDYLDSLRRVRDIPVKLSLPGHRESGDYRTRVDELLAHHERRLNEALTIIKEDPGLNATEIAGLMKWKIHAVNWDTFPLIQKWFAVGEGLSHLDYLLKRGKIRVEKTDGIRRYYAV